MSSSICRHGITRRPRLESALYSQPGAVAAASESHYTGYVDIMVYPNGKVVPTTVYSTPTAVGLASAFSHFWLAERSDVYAPQHNADVTGTTNYPPYLPLPQGWRPALLAAPSSRGNTGWSRSSPGTVRSRPTTTCRLTRANIGTANYNASISHYIQAQQGVRGGN